MFYNGKLSILILIRYVYNINIDRKILVFGKVRDKIIDKFTVKDHDKKYWKKTAKSNNIEKIMEKICHNYTREEFENKKESILFELEIKLENTMTVLDLGCGLGRTCKWVAPKVFYYIGIDYVDEMIEKARMYNSNITNAKFMVRDGNTYLPINSVDVVYSEIAFQHMDKNTQKNYINNLRLVTKPSGLFYVQLPKKENYQVGWKISELDDLFNGWDYNIIPVKNKNYDAYYTIKATPN